MCLCEKLCLWAYRSSVTVMGDSCAEYCPFGLGVRASQKTLGLLMPPTMG